MLWTEIDHHFAQFSKVWPLDTCESCFKCACVYIVPMAQSTFPLLFLITKGPEPGMKTKCFQIERRKQLIMALFQKIIFISFCTVVTGLDTLHYIYPCTHVPPPPPTHTHTKNALHSKHISHLPSTREGFLHKTACPSKLFTFS